MFAIPTSKWTQRIACIVAAYGLSVTPALAQEFARTFGLSNQTAVASTVEACPDGGLIVPGFDLDGTQAIASATKFDAVGNIEWRRTYRQGADNTQLSGAAALPNDETILVGHYNNFPWIMKVDRIGIPVWQQTTSVRAGRLHEVIVASDGSIYAAGNTENRFGNTMLALAKYDSDGNREWQFGYGGNLTSDHASSVRETHDGHVLIAGRINDDTDLLLVKIEPNGRSVWAQKITTPPSSVFAASPRIDIAPNGDILLSAGRTYTNSNDDKMWAIRMDSNAQILWNRTFTRGIDSSKDIAVLPNGDIVLAGTSEQNGNHEFLVLRLDSNGDRVWHKTFGGNGTEVLNGMCLTSDGNIAFVGFSDSFDIFNAPPQYWLVKVNGNGELTPNFPYAQDAAVAAQFVSDPSESSPIASDFPPAGAGTAIVTAFSSLEQSLQTVTNAFQWTDLGHGLGGSEGVPYMAGAGTLRAGSYMGLVMTSMRPNSVVFLFASNQRLDAPLLGGTLVPYPGLVLNYATTPLGHMALETEWPDSVPPGVSLYLQGIVPDINAPQRYAFTNAVVGITP